MRKKPRESIKKPRWKKSRLEDLVGRVIEDLEDDEEREMAFFEAIAEHVRFPFKLKDGIARGIAVNEDDEIVLLLDSGPLPLLEVEIPRPAPKGAEWIEAYRLWTAE